jgi:hypothetical protein
MADMNSQTVEGLLAFCDYLKEKHYLGTNTVEGWKTAIKKVFEGVEGDAHGAVQLTGLDLDSYLRRFQVAEGRGYKTETIGVYGRRIKNAIEAQQHYLDTGDVPTFKTGAIRSKDNGEAAKPKPKQSTPAKRETKSGQETGDLIEFPFPLRTGQMARLHLPPQGLHPKDADRMSAFLRTLQLEEQRQLPEKTGEEQEAA